MKKKWGFINWIVLGLLLVFPMLGFAQTSGTSNERITGNWRFEQKTDFIMAQPSDTKTAIQITGGSVRIGTGTPGVTPGQNDVYIGGTLEVDGVPNFGATTIVLRGITYTLPTDDGDAGEQLQSNGTGTLTWEAAGGTATAWDDIGNPDAAGNIDFTTFANVLTGAATAVNQHQFINTGNMGDVAIVYIQQMTGIPTDGKLLYGTMASDLVDGIQIYSSDTDIEATGQVLLRLDFKDNDDPDGYYIVGRDNTSADTHFAVRMDGAMAISQNFTLNGAAPSIITSAAGEALTLNVANGDAAGEDLIITANNVSLTAVGLMTFSPDAALPIAIDASDTDIATALNVGANDIVGTTGLINYTNFDVNADGDVVCVDLTASGTVSIGILKQDSLIPATPGATILVNGSVAGGVTIGGVSIGTITFGGGGGATLVNLPATVNMTIADGTLSVVDTAAGPTLTVTNNTLTNSNLVTLSATAITTGHLVSAVGGGNVAGALYYAQATEGAGFTGYYFYGYDGTADDITIKRHGITVITGSALGADAFTLTHGDILVSDGHLDITAGTLTVGTGTITTGTGSMTITTNGNFSTARGGITCDTVDDDSSYIKRNQTITGAALFTIEETHTGADFPALVVTQNATGGIDGIDISYGGSTRAIHTTLTAAAGDGIYFTVPASYTGQLIKSDLLAWLGTSGEGGIIDIVTTAAATAEVGQGIRLNFLGTGAAGTAVQGKGLHVHANAAAKAGESLVYLDTLFNTAIHINNNGVSADGIKFDVNDAYVGQGIVADLGPHVGTVNEGFIDIITDSAATDVAGQILRINLQDSLVDTTAISGKAIYAKEVSPVKSGTYLVHFESTSNGSLFLSGPVSLQAAAPLVGASPIVLEGATADGFELTLAVTDPESDTTITIPDGPASSDMPVVLAAGGTTQTATNATATVTGSSIAIPAGHAAAGQMYQWLIGGTKTGANAAMQVHLYLSDGQVMSLSASDAAAGDWIARFTMFIIATNSERIIGELLVNGKVVVTDYATAAKDISGAVNVYAQITSAHAGDAVTSDVTRVSYNQ